MTMDKGSTMRELVIAVGGPLQAGENRKSWLVRVAEAAGVSPRVVRAAFYGETNSRIAAAKLKAAAGKNAPGNIASAAARLATALEVKDQDFYGPHVSALRDMAGAMRDLADAMRRRDAGGSK